MIAECRVERTSSPEQGSRVGRADSQPADFISIEMAMPVNPFPRRKGQMIAGLGPPALVCTVYVPGQP